jgi:hypothetical protein
VIRFVRISKKRWLYWGEEDEIETGNDPLAWFWFKETGKPFRTGTGIRFRETHDTAWHIGIAKLSGASSHVGVLGGQDLPNITPSDIRGWVAPSQEEPYVHPA